MSDEELDKLFKNATKEFRADNDMSGWNEMSSKLEHADRMAWYRNRAVLVILFSIVMVGSFTLWYSNISKVKNIEPIGENKTSSDQPILKELESNVNYTDSVKTVAVEKPIRTLANTLAEKDKGAVAIKKMDKPQVTTSNLHTESSDTENLKSQGVISSEALEDNNFNLSEIPSDSKMSLHNNSLSKSNEGTLIKPIETDSIAVVSVDDNEKEDLTDSLDSQIDKKNPEMMRGFSVKVSIAPDFSSTELFNHSKPGFDFGITTGYNFNDHWSVYTGVILAKKVYSSTNIDESYNTSNGYNYPIEELYGDCRMLDIPLNFYYSFNQKSSVSFKVGLGFSSYIMLKEDYKYVLDKPYGSSEYYQSFENQNNEWFKMLNLSFMVQKRLNDHLYLEVEPFVKIPMVGIGAGDISLYSLGSFVSLRYDFY